MILVEVKKFSKGKDGTYYIELQDNSLMRCMRIDKDGGVTVSPSGWFSEHEITKCTVDPESVAFKYIKSAFIQDGASEDDAFAFAAYVLWDLSPKANIFQEVDENVIGELVINRNISYAAEELLKAIVSYYLDCISGEKAIQIVHHEKVRESLMMEIDSTDSDEIYYTGFDMFWAVYPRKTGRDKALENYMELVKINGVEQEDLVKAAVNYNFDYKDFIASRVLFLECADQFLDPERRLYSKYIDEIETRVCSREELDGVMDDCPF